uniref:p45 n=1 Tax=Lymantria dispar multicapsid nuclear polyhedrosis virus TaxID=10449 RepID=V9TGM4_NPVLD|nr:P45 [Lymantria dispar multiple nucleopolyhedrovirus]QPD01899.1 P45 [Lymantria dispar multiple nucleopolyhedrovirus]QPD02073.1 P45 [Lymantria dispar multiple nucleopolyhedrovirus]
MDPAQELCVEYSLQFKKNADDVKNVMFEARLTVSEIDSLAFLFSKFYDQNKHVHVKGLTFFNEFNKCIDYVKQNFDAKQQSDDIKQIFSIFLRHEFMTQVPHFKKITQYLQKYYKPSPSPCVPEIAARCQTCSAGRLQCLTCKSRYVSSAVAKFSSTLHDGWDIFLRPMFGLPLFLYVCLKTRFDAGGVFNADDLITDAFARFLFNLLSDKSADFVQRRAVAPLVEECRRAVVNLSVRELELLLCTLRNKNTCETILFAPFKQFITKLALKTKIKHAKISKIASVVFTGFFLRLYLDGAEHKIAQASGADVFFSGDGTLTPFEVEVRNVCRFVLPQYTDEQLSGFVAKLARIRDDLAVECYIVTEKQIRQLVTKHNLDEDFAVLINQNV